MMVFGAEQLTFYAKLMSFLMKPMIRSMAKMCGKDLAELKAALEKR